MIAEIGRLTRDAEVKTVTAGDRERHVLNNCLAVKVYKDETAFINMTAWDGNADFIGANFKKGNELFIEGELRSKKQKVGDKEIDIPFILVNRVKFTHGNKTIEDFV